jgi:hypothetical protein
MVNARAIERYSADELAAAARRYPAHINGTPP